MREDNHEIIRPTSPAAVVINTSPPPQLVSPVTMKRKPEQHFDSSWDMEDEDWALFQPSQKRIRRHSAKSVRFSPDNEVSFRHLSEEDLANAWYKPRDWQSFKAEARETVALIIKANGDLSCLDYSKHCIHGLEEYIARCMVGQSRSPRQRMIVRQIVLVQQWQRKKGIEDQAAIKNAYLKLSSKHRSRAVRRASLEPDPPSSTAMNAPSTLPPIECKWGSF